MPYYGFKVNPKTQVINKVHALWGRTTKVKVLGTRGNDEECVANDVPLGSYLVQCNIDGACIAKANNRDWRKAYGLLVLEVEKAFKEKTAETV